MRIGSLFSGYGGLDMGVHAVLGGEVAWHSEVDKAASRILDHRWPEVPNLGDITAVDWTTVEPVDVLTGGFPCQDVSHAGKRAGIRPDTRSGLWSHFAYAIDQLRPRLVVIENVRGLLSAKAHSDVEPCPWCVGDDTDGALRALGAVLGDLAGLGYDARWAGVRAADAGAPHGRFRIFIVAYPCGGSLEGLAAAGDGLPVAAERGDAAAGSAEGTGSRLGLQGSSQRPTRGAGSATPADAAQSERRTSQPEHLAAAIGRAAEPRERAGTDWGDYAAAIHRWERTLGRVAPPPAEVGAKGQPRLSPRFVEWMMGLPAGHVTGVDISCNDQLKALGNGVVPQQAELALRWLLFGEWTGVDHADPLLYSPSAQEPGYADAATLVDKNAQPATHLNQRVYDPGTGRLVQTGLTQQQVQLLPTPAVNDMGAGKSVEAWDEWTDRMKAEHGNGNGHGKSLAIEAQRLLPTPSVAGATGGHLTRSGSRSNELLLPGVAKSLGGDAA